MSSTHHIAYLFPPSTHPRYQTQNLTFASVHDSYWTHASDIDRMSEIIRNTFIALHSSDVLGKLQYEVSLPSIFLASLLFSHNYFLRSFNNGMRATKLLS